MSDRWTVLLNKFGVWKPSRSVDKTVNESRSPGVAARKWRDYNHLEDGNIYSIRPKNIASEDMPMLKRPPTAEELKYLDTDMTNKYERRYINRVRIASPTSRTFKKQILQKYHAPPRDRGLGYRMNRPPKEKRDEHELAVEAIKKKPTIIRTATMGVLAQPVECQNPCRARHAYCEVLGPATCAACIESTNKIMAEELQRRLFPGIDTSTNSLVAPRVAEILCRSDNSAQSIPYIREGVIDYRALRRKSTVTDRFRRIKIAAPDLARPFATPKVSSRRLKRQQGLPALAHLLKTML